MPYSGLGVREGTRQTPSSFPNTQGKERNGRFECSVPRAGLVVFVLSGEAKDIEFDPEESLAISPV